MEEFRITQLTDKRRIPELIDLFVTGLGKTDASFWCWKYWDENGLPERYMLIIENCENKIIGMMGFQFLRYFCSDNMLSIVQTQDLVISPDYRGMGLMRKLYFYAMDFCAERGGDAFVAYPNDNSYPIFLKYGAQDMNGVGSLNTKKKGIHNFFVPIKAKTLGEYEFEVKSCIPNDIFFSESTTKYKLRKSYEYMKWKFDDNPEEDFLWLTVRCKGSLIGWFVFQVYKGRFNKAVNIYDFEFKDTMSDKSLLTAETILHSYGAWVSLWGRPEDIEKKRMFKAGFSEQGVGLTSFTLHPFFKNTAMPDNWRLTRADLDY